VQELWAVHDALSTQPEYRQTLEAAGVARFAPEVEQEGRRRASSLGEAQKRVEALDARVDTAVRGLLSGKRATPRPSPSKERMKQAAAAVALAKSPDLLAATIAERVADFGADAPGLAQGVQETAQRALLFLAQKAPRPPMGPLGDMPALRAPWKPSELELERWSAAASAVENPLSVLEDAAAGRLTEEGLEALRTVYPELHQHLLERTMAQLASLETPLPYAQRVALGQLIGLPLDESLQPEVLASLQQVYALPPEAAQPRPGANGTRGQRRLEQEFSPGDDLRRRA
jgi:hypothetical protein